MKESLKQRIATGNFSLIGLAKTVDFIAENTLRGPLMSR
jgi:hypothetical protein